MPSMADLEPTGSMPPEEVAHKKAEEVNVLIQLRDALKIKAPGWKGLGYEHQRVTDCKTVTTNKWNPVSSELIVRIDLYNSGLVGGPIPNSIGWISELRKVDFSFNSIRGQLPPTIGKLLHLTELKLGENEMRGILPPALFELSCLEQLCLQQNMFTGELPDELGNLTCLQRLWLDRNQFSGCVPWKSIARLNQLEELDLSSNPFEPGELPHSPSYTVPEGNKENETQIEKATKEFDVELQERPMLDDTESPAEGGGVEIVEYLEAVDLSGLQKLKKLTLVSMNITGSIPPTLGNIPKLQRLQLQNNRLTGEIPATLQGLTSLKELVLSHNNLSIPLGSGVSVDDLWCENPAEIASLFNVLHSGEKKAAK